MNKLRMNLMTVAVSTALSVAATAAVAAPWTYRGSLTDSGQPANGSYDLRVTLLNEGSNAALSSPVTLHQVPVTDGAFSVEVDFGIDLGKAPAMRLKTEVAQGASAFVELGEPTHFDAKAALGKSLCWNTDGNDGTSTNTNFLGTTDSAGLVLRTNNASTLSLLPSSLIFNNLPITANVIAGSSTNALTTIFAGLRGATIAGGGMPFNSDPDFTDEGPNLVSDSYGTVSGGFNNIAGDSGNSSFNAGYATVSGGRSNVAGALGAVVGGGRINIASGIFDTVGGGDNNTASGTRSVVGGGANNTATGITSTVGGGSVNVASGLSSTVGGGVSNIASGERSTVSGGLNNCAGGDFSWAGGRRAKVRPGNEAVDGACVAPAGNPVGHEGTFMWGGAIDSDFTSTGANQFAVRSNSVFFGDVNASSVSIPIGRFLHTSTGAGLSTGGTWTNASSRSLKTAFQGIDPMAVLAKVASLPLGTWAYKNSEEGRHLGPTAEDFQSAFGLGGDGKSIATVDADGVALAAIQGLNQKFDTERAALSDENAALKAALKALEARLQVLEENR